MGNPLKRDDNIGNIIAKKLGGIIAEVSPENYTSKDEDFVIIDAIDFGGEVGEVRLFRSSDVVAQLATTHNIPITIFTDLGKRLRIVGIQPKDISLGKGLSSELYKKIPEIVEKVKKLIGLE